MYSVCTGLTQLYLLVEFKVFCVYKVQLHVSALDNGHLQVAHEIFINPLNAQLNPTCHLLALLGPHHILHVSRVRVKSHLPSVSIIRSSPYFLRYQDKG
jgi:hypothetical protein